jgi:hypothetical protein
MGFADEGHNPSACCVLISAFHDFKPTYLAQGQFADGASRSVFDQLKG